MIKDQHEYLILRSLSGSITSEENQELRSWLDTSPENQRAFEEFQKVWQLSSFPEDMPDFQTQQEWEKLQAAIEHEEQAYHRPKTVLYRKLPLLAGAAAVALLFLIAFGAYLSRLSLLDTEGLIVKESTEQPIDFVLPDGSHIYLNRHSKLSYRQDFNEQERKVELSGEAFFEVEKNPDKPFVIHADAAAIRVLGTSFNVKALEQTAQTAVYVLSGKVSLSAIEHEERGAAEERETAQARVIVLKPGETGFLHKKDLSLSLQKEEASNVLAWKDRKLIFQKAELQQVLKTLEEYFELDIYVANPAILSCRFTSAFHDPELEEVLDVLRISLNLNISSVGKSLRIEGDGCQ